MSGSGGGIAIVDERFCFEDETHLTVQKTCVFFPGDSFIVYDPKGEVIFRIDSYGPNSQPKDELFLMEASGKCLLTLLRKKPSLHHRWDGYLGEKTEDQEPFFSVRRSLIIGRSTVVVHVHGEPGEEYQIVGSFPQRRCTSYNTSWESPSNTKEAVAKIKRKVDPTSNMTLGRDVFLLCLKPGFDGAFTMGLVLMLDQMYGDDHDDVQWVDPTPEDSSS